MYMFQSDYLEGCHPRILEALNKTNYIQQVGYGLDEYSESAKKAIKTHLNNVSVDIHFVMGGTSANQIVISSILKPYQGVISLDTGHINVHETGAIEATGHKVITIKGNKMTKELLEENINILNTNEHEVMPKMLYLSFPSEYGLVYSKKELEDLYKFAKAHNLYLYIDGARLSYGLASSDVKFSDLPNLCDIFYIGLTKCMGLCGEAIVICNNNLKEGFRHNIKQRGAMLAKGRLLGIQFYEMFKDNLYFEIGQKTIEMVNCLINKLKEKKIERAIDSPSNQQFFIISKDKYNELKKEFIFEEWQDLNDKIMIRICLNYFTKKETIDYLISKL